MSKVVHYTCDGCGDDLTMQSDDLPPGWCVVETRIKEGFDRLGDCLPDQYVCPKCVKAERFMKKRGWFAAMDFMMAITMESLEGKKR